MVKFLTAKDLRSKKPEQLEKILKEKQEHSRELRFQIGSRQVKNHRELRFLKKEIARILSIMAEINSHKK